MISFFAVLMHYKIHNFIKIYYIACICFDVNSKPSGLNNDLTSEKATYIFAPLIHDLMIENVKKNNKNINEKRFSHHDNVRYIFFCEICLIIIVFL